MLRELLNVTAMARNQNKIRCKLTTPELRQRKATIIALLKGLVLEKQEISNGFKYSFKGSDEVLDLLNDFIKTERRCCDFFNFRLTVANQESPVWLGIIGS